MCKSKLRNFDLNSWLAREATDSNREQITNIVGNIKKCSQFYNTCITLLQVLHKSRNTGVINKHTKNQ